MQGEGLASLYNRVLNETKYNPGDRVLLWSTEIESQEGKKVIKPWIGAVHCDRSERSCRV